ncbi:D-2-hydroxyacid dehydrogenase [Psychromarinibacter sp. C21-152]|uniref:D-2-hydroxyacid dehydrogenase n=1 Tax=Psychromarinibacter sediminicola TaxID=3033385 RepID=A0AAE3NWR2_9RHOB|nr:D-2-hydroxyacid dehydrogenase [Psychromarinibacter sediminicola]MDF0603537.1 D-2-hydroxyacid dehydrogenase [Psychromarinibacter sediminicola]
MRRIVFLERQTMGPSIECCGPDFAHVWTAYKTTRASQVVDRLADAEIAVVNKTRIGRAELERLPELRFIAIAATGHDNVDLQACEARGVTVSNVRDYAASTVPEHVFALLLALSKNLVGYKEGVAAGTWQGSGQFCYFDRDIRSLKGTRLAIFGGGTIGRAVAAIAAAFEMDVVFAARKGDASVPKAPYVSFDEALETADVLTMHAPLTAETRGLIGHDEFARMKRRPIVINCGRGGLIDETAAARALESARISAIGVDVLSTEPPEPDNALLKLAGRPDVIVTPHIAWAAPEARREVWRQVIESIEAYAAGAPVRTLTGALRDSAAS